MEGGGRGESTLVSIWRERHCEKKTMHAMMREMIWVANHCLQVTLCAVSCSGARNHLSPVPSEVLPSFGEVPEVRSSRTRVGGANSGTWPRLPPSPKHVS